MYIPSHFIEHDSAEIEKLVREFSFATLVSIKDELPWATHIPLQLHIQSSGVWHLHGHIARANPQWKNFESQPDVLAIFMGPHSYVSPSWYNHKNVPTWNYLATHLYGKVHLTPEDESEQMLRSLMAHYENKHAEKPQSFDEIPAHTLEKDLRGVVCFEIKVERVEAIRKLSQNRDTESHGSVVEHLKKMNTYDAARIALEMEKNKNQ